MGIYGFADKLTGYYRVVCPARYRERAATAVMRSGIRHGGFSLLQDGSLCFSVGSKEMPGLRRIIDKSGVVGYSLYGRGLPFLLSRYRRRVGFAVGAATFLCIVYLSTLFVWRVDVADGTSLNRTVVEERLAEAGIGVGTYIPSCDLAAVAEKYLTKYDDCAWITVNMSGTVAQVELSEMLPRPASKEEGPCNVIAGYGGVIDSFVINSGKGYVSAGDVVLEGDLLVSGVIEDLQGDTRLTAADAEVYAEVERRVTVSVPIAYSERVYTGRESHSFTVGFFGAEARLPFGAKDPGGEWERSSDRSVLTLPDGRLTPFSVTETVWREYGEVKLTRTGSQAKAIARAELARAVADELNGARILEISTAFSSDGTAVTAEARVRCICNIAKKQEIMIKNEVETDRGE